MYCQTLPNGPAKEPVPGLSDGKKSTHFLKSINTAFRRSIYDLIVLCSRHSQGYIIKEIDVKLYRFAE
jgi:hypothetical protein